MSSAFDRTMTARHRLPAVVAADHARDRHGAPVHCPCPLLSCTGFGDEEHRDDGYGPVIGFHGGPICETVPLVLFARPAAHHLSINAHFGTLRCKMPCCDRSSAICRRCHMSAKERRATSRSSSTISKSSPSRLE